MLICYLLVCLGAAISIITVNSLYFQIFKKQAMKQIGQKFSVSKKERDFEDIPLLTFLERLVFPRGIGLNSPARPALRTIGLATAPVHTGCRTGARESWE